MEAKGWAEAVVWSEFRCRGVWTGIARVQGLAWSRDLGFVWEFGKGKRAGWSGKGFDSGGMGSGGMDGLVECGVDVVGSWWASMIGFKNF